MSLSSLKITSRTLFKVKIQNKIRCAQFGKIKGMTWQKDAFSDDAWRCRVSQTLDGKLLQARGAATKNARSPIVVRHEDGVTRADVDEDRSLFLVSTSTTRRSFARYGGAVPWGSRIGKPRGPKMGGVGPSNPIGVYAYAIRKANRNSYAIYQMVPFPMILNEP